MLNGSIMSEYVMLNLIIIKRPSGIYQAEYLVYTWVELANPTQEVPYAIV
jgi:hypothetical protein